MFFSAWNISKREYLLPLQFFKTIGFINHIDFMERHTCRFISSDRRITFIQKISFIDTLIVQTVKAPLIAFNHFYDAQSGLPKTKQRYENQNVFTMTNACLKPINQKGKNMCKDLVVMSISKYIKQSSMWYVLGC